MNFDFLLLDNKKDLVQYRTVILELFNACFGEKLDQSIWDWAYLDNPMGNPFVSLCFDDEVLAGHYAIIPYNLVHNGRTIQACLSLTSMVDVKYRKCGLFVEQAKRVFEKAKDSGVDLVFGFPNAKSTPGFRKRLGWILEAPDIVASVTMKELSDSSEFMGRLENNSLIKINREDSEYWQWRMSKPHQEYADFGSVVTKVFNDDEDIVFIDQIRNDSSFDTQKFNILVDASVDDLKPHSVFSYQFGYLPLTESVIDLDFKKDLIMSDVF
jgi:hypothetical protein